jgi:DNA-binding response OmpR family regulator
MFDEHATQPVALMIEDDPDTAYLIDFILSGEGYAVRWLESADAFAHYLMTQPPAEVVVLDVVLRNMRGLDLLQQLRAHPQWQDTAVVVVSAHDVEDTLTRALQLGADDYMAKPFDPIVLQSRVRRHRGRMAGG